MLCPFCKNEMIVVEHNKIELDYCHSCKGVWFDSGELELLLESMHLKSSGLFLSNLLTSAEAGTSEKKRKCPICRQKMKKVTLSKEPEVLIDACHQGHGLWFDGGEVGQVIKQLTLKPSAKANSHQQVVTFLGETFKARE